MYLYCYNFRVHIVKKYKFELIIGVLIILLYFALRLPNLTLQPIFADEAIYIRWAQVMRAEPTLRFLPLSDGKTPLFMWSLMPVLKFIEDPLFAGRILSVGTGFLTLLGVGFLGWKFFNPKVGLWSGFIYSIIPYSVFFDRMALVDSMFAAFSIWSLNFALLLVKYQRLDIAMMLGYLLGGGMLTKTPAMVNLFLLPLTVISGKWKIKLAGLWIVSLGIALSLYNLLRLGPNFSQLSSRNGDYTFSISFLLSHPFDPFIPHIRDLLDWFPIFLGWPVLILVVIGIILTIREKNKTMFVILSWSLIPLLIQTAILKTFTARYLLFTIPPFLALAGLGAVYITKKIKISAAIKTLAIIVLLAAWPIYFNYLLLTNLEKVPLPKEERVGYLEEWTAGYGFKEIANFLIDQKKNGSVVVGTEGYFGTLPDGLAIYLDKAEIPVIGDSATISGKLRDAAWKNKVFYVANRNRVGENLGNANLIKEYLKVKPLDGRQQDAIVVYQVEP